MTVDGNILELYGFEVAGDTERISALKYGPEKRGRDPATLMLRIDSQNGEVPVRLRDVAAAEAIEVSDRRHEAIERAGRKPIREITGADRFEMARADLALRRWKPPGGSDNFAMVDERLSKPVSDS